MKLVSWNVNGIRAVTKKGLFTPFLDAFAADVVCLQETKAQRGQIDVETPGYFSYWNCAAKKGYSGTALLSQAEPASVTMGLPADIVERYGVDSDTFGDPNDEGRIIAAELADVIVVTVYTPNSKGDLGRLGLRHTQWDPAFLAYVKRLEASKPVVFCGDLNVAHTPDDLANPKPNVGKNGFTDEERDGFQSFLDAGFVDTFRIFTEGNGHYTWWSHFAKSRERNVGWRIDYALVSAQLAPLVTSAEIHPDVMGSDHCPITLELSL